MAISSSSLSSISAPLSYTCLYLPRLDRVSRTSLRSPPNRTLPRLAVSSRLYSPKPSSSSVSPEDHYELQYDFPPQYCSTNAAPIFITLPLDSVSSTGQMHRPKDMWGSFRALTTAGVEGIVVEVLWGTVKRGKPRAILKWWRAFEKQKLSSGHHKS